MSEISATRVLLIGPLPPATPSDANPVGGAAVNFGEMMTHLTNRDFQLAVVNTTRPRVNLARWRRWHNDVTTGVRILTRVLLHVKHCDVVLLNISAGPAWSLGAMIWAICAVVERPMLLRFFGGDLAMKHAQCGVLGRWWAEYTFLRSDLVFVQTKIQLWHFGKRSNFRWFANTRDLTAPTGEDRPSVSKFLFISQLRMEKGFKESLDAFRDLPTGCELSIYGPVMPNTDMSLLEDHPNATYRGILAPYEVPAVIVQHDVLLLPTYWESEGYPGIILEALQCGRPVITTRWESIPEVVEDERSGLLIEPRSAVAVKQAILRIVNDPDLYRRLCMGARVRGEIFRSSRWYHLMAQEIAGVVARG